MFKIPVVIWIANAAARLAGTHGDVTQQAEVAGCSRQTVYDHAQKVPAAIAAEHSGGPTRAELGIVPISVNSATFKLTLRHAQRRRLDRSRGWTPRVGLLTSS